MTFNVQKLLVVNFMIDKDLYTVTFIYYIDNTNEVWNIFIDLYYFIVLYKFK